MTSSGASASSVFCGIISWSLSDVDEMIVDLIGSAGAQGSTAGTFRSGFCGGSELLELDESTSGSKAGFVMLKFHLQKLCTFRRTTGF